jgi:hypothetical protein
VDVHTLAVGTHGYKQNVIRVAGSLRFFPSGKPGAPLAPDALTMDRKLAAFETNLLILPQCAIPGRILLLQTTPHPKSYDFGVQDGIPKAK